MPFWMSKKRRIKDQPEKLFTFLPELSFVAVATRCMCPLIPQSTPATNAETKLVQMP